MDPAIDEFQKRKQYGPNERRLSPSGLTLEGRADGLEGNVTEDGEDDLRIMQHFVTDFIEWS
jgi:hypothetical protein